MLLRDVAAAMALVLRSAVATMALVLHGATTVNAVLQQWYCWSDGAGVTRRSCSDGAAAEISFCFFFLLESFKSENENEKEKKERDLKPVSRLYWLA